LKKAFSMAQYLRRIILTVGLLSFLIVSIIRALVDISDKKQELSDLMYRTVETYQYLVQDYFENFDHNITQAIQEIYKKEPAKFITYINNYLNLTSPNDIYLIVDRSNIIHDISPGFQEYIGIKFLKNDVPQGYVHQSRLTLYPVMDIKYPLDEKHTLIIERDIKSLQKLFKRYQPVKISEQGELFILNNNGIVVMHPRQQWVNSRYNLGFELTHWTPKDKHGLQSYQYGGKTILNVKADLKIPAGWTLYYSIPYQTLINYFISAWLYDFLLIAGFIILSIIFIVYFVRKKITQPIQDLVSNLATIETGREQLSWPEPASFASQEVEQIKEAVFEMLNNIHHFQEQLLEREEILKTVTDHSLDWSYWKGDDGRLIYTSPNCLALTGYSQDEFYRNPDLINTIIYDDDKSLWTNHVHIINKGNTIEPIEFRIVRKDGHLKWIRHVCQQITSADGTKRGIRGSNNDITQRKKAELAFQEQSYRLETTLQSIADGVIALDTQKRIILMNKAAEYLTGWDKTEAIGNSIEHVFNIQIENGPSLNELLSEVIMRGKKIELEKNGRLTAKDGREFLISDSAAPILDEHGYIYGVVIVFRDITQRVKMEEELIRAQKLESIGVLAGGIAHDFNNILTAILGNIMLAREFSADVKIAQRLQEAEKATLRAKTLTNQLLTFSKGGLPVTKTMAIERLVRESCSFALTGSSCKLELNIPENLWNANIDEGQISQVLHNIVLNAAQAMPSGGIIRVSANNFTLGTEDKLPLAPGKYILLKIEDQGIGIAPEYLNRIFDPYFTTKNRGNGLGLATSYSIINNHNGHITVSSTPGKGTIFSIYLPAGKDDKTEKNDDAVSERFSFSGKALIMDDEEPVREILKTMLTQIGFTVDAAEDGRSALNIFTSKKKEQHGSYDLIIMDLTVPGGMGGKEAVKKIRAMDEDVAVLVSSGYSNDPVLSHYYDFGFNAVVKKPFTFEELAETVKNVLTKAT